MNQSESGYTDVLKPLKVRFFIAAILLLAVAVTGTQLHKSSMLLKNTLADLAKAQSGLVRVKEASASRRLLLATLQAQLGQRSHSSSPEMVLYQKVDEIKARLNPEDMTITAVEKKGGEASLHYTLTFNSKDFNNLLNAVNYLHEATFPSSPVSSVAVTQSVAGEKVGVHFKVTGSIVMSEKTKP